MAPAASVFASGGRVNVIPQGRLNGPMMQMLDLVPLPNQEGDLDNYFNSGTQRLNRNNFDAKVNWNRNDRHQLFFKYSVMDALVHGDFGLGAAGGECVCDGGVGDGHTLVQIGGIGQTYTVSPNFLLDGTFGWTRFGQNVVPPDLGTNFGLDVLGIPGTNGPDPRESGMPPHVHLRVFRPGEYGGLEPAVSQRPVVHVQHECKLDEGRARHPVRLRLPPSHDEALAAGARLRPARSVRLRFRGDGPQPRGTRCHGRVPGRNAVLRERLEWPRRVSPGHPDVLRARAASSSR